MLISGRTLDDFDPKWFSIQRIKTNQSTYKNQRKTYQTWSHGKNISFAQSTLKQIEVYNSIVPQIYESAFRQKKAGFKTYLLQQQQMR